MSTRTQRTTHRSGNSRKMYAVRDPRGQFKDVQTYQRAHRADLRYRSEAERMAAKRS